MEIIEWAIQLKSLASHSLTILKTNLNNYQLDTYPAASLILAAYFILILIHKTKNRSYCLVAFLFCLVIARSPIYNNLDAVQYHAIFAIIYITLTYLVKPIKVKVACCMLGTFQFLMAWDSFANATIETFIWLHYETVICVLHAFVIGSFLERDIERIKSIVARLIGALRRGFVSACNNTCLWYH